MKKREMAAVILTMALCGTTLWGCGNAAAPAATAAAPAETAEAVPAETNAAAPAERPASQESSAAETEKKTSDTSRVAGAGDMTTVEDVVEEGMVPVPVSDLAPGEYELQVDSSSSMFKITDCRLTVPENGAEEAEVLLTMSGSAYIYLYPGTGEEAAAAAEADLIPAGKNAEGKSTFVFPLAALDAGVPCAAFSKNKEMWYDRTLVFRADSLPLSAFREGVVLIPAGLDLEDGEYTAEVTLKGGSGKASVQSPARISLSGTGTPEAKATAELIWGSANYDYMLVNGEKYLAEIVDGHSVFEIPVSCFDRNMPVIADTTAMSQPHEISYTLRFDSATLAPAGTVKEIPRTCAEQFRMQRLPGGCTLLTVAEDERFLVVPEGTAKENADEDLETARQLTAAEKIPVLQLPLRNLYVADSSVMDLFRELDALDAVRFTATREDDWKIPEIAAAMKEERILFAGKYSAPDYELLLEEGASLAIENTMIFHSPETKEQLERLGIPVLVDRASYETHPLGRLEWIRLVGLLTGKEAEAEAFFREQAGLADTVRGEGDTGKTAAFFYLSAGGYVNVRRPEDYIPKMMELAGGRYILSDLPGEDSARSTMNMQAEAFYAAARDADVLIYNATVEGGLSSLEELLRKADWLKDFKAVKEGQVWCTEQNMFQQTSGIAGMIGELHEVFLLAGEAKGSAELNYFYRLR